MKSVLALVALLVVTGCGAADPETAPTEAVPQVCLDALDYADTVQDLAVEGFGLTSEGFDAASRNDAAGLEKMSDDLDDLSPDMADAVDEYRAARDDCKAAS